MRSPAFADPSPSNVSQPDYCDTGWDVLRPGDIRRAAQQLVGHSVTGMTRASGGVVNQVWHVRFAVHCGMTLKIAPRWFADSLRREARCLRPGHDLLLMITVGGRPLRRTDLVPARLPDLLRPSHTLHGTALSGYGWCTADFTGRYQSWRSYLFDLEEAPEFTTVPAWRLRREELLGLLAVVPEVIPAHLLYGDYNRDNFLVTGDGTLVTLDFQGCFAGDPLYDWATILLKEPDCGPLFARVLELTNGHGRRIRAYQARVLWNMAVYYCGQDPRRSEALAHQLDFLLDSTIRR
ncbi:MAG: phosphotransferase [Streptosporangiaceae bacterium]|nr:phosphotransferase [Streptosporangiaceae bacterium]